MPSAKREKKESEHEELKKSGDNEYRFSKNEFQQLWFRVRNENEVDLRKSIVRSVLVSKTFTVAQAVSIIKLFHSSSDKIEVLRVMGKAMEDSIAGLPNASTFTFSSLPSES